MKGVKNGMKSPQQNTSANVNFALSIDSEPQDVQQMSNNLHANTLLHSSGPGTKTSTAKAVIAKLSFSSKSMGEEDLDYNTHGDEINEQVYQLIQFNLALMNGKGIDSSPIDSLWSLVRRLLTILLCITDIFLIVILGYLGGYFHKKSFFAHFREGAKDRRERDY